MTKGSKATQKPGPLIIIGGSEDKLGNCDILREFVRLSGGPNSNIVIMTVAARHPKEVGQEYSNVFKNLLHKCTNASVKAVDIESREEANDEKILTILSQATGVFFTGGDQYRITTLLGGTKADILLHDHHERGLALAGTSAGASMMSSIMIVSGIPEEKPRLGSIKLGAGMEFLPGVIIDQHFGERGRINRLLAAVGQFPHQLGLGIDEDTAAVVEGHSMRVVGSGTITIVDAASTMEECDKEAKEGEPLVLCNVKLHILPANYKFDLLNRVPISRIKNSSTRTGT